MRERRKKGIRSLGRSRAGQTTKFHLALSGSGVISWYLGPGNEGDSIALQKLWSQWDWSRIFAVVADRAYDSNDIRKLIAFYGALALIPPNPTRRYDVPAYDETLYAGRKKI